MENRLDADLLRRMFLAGANALSAKKEEINELNVFPVPDGDTGTNMTMTIMAAAQAIEPLDDPSIEMLAKLISSGSLRGARGNSGVILSQLFRGFTRSIRELNTLGTTEISAAMDRGVETAYKAVMQPKEGTILTVAKSMAVYASALCLETEDLGEFFEKVLEEGERSLAHTPDLLPVLKEAGVVDSGGKGLMTILHGAVDCFNGKSADVQLNISPGAAQAAPLPKKREHISTDEIKYGYCTEFIIVLTKPIHYADEQHLKEYLGSIGDSLVVVADDEVVKIHVHTNDPGLAIQKGLTYGELTRLKIDNMREEHKETLFDKETPETAAAEEPRKKTAFISVCAGDGLADIFRQLGADEIISGGQAMNPSTDDLLGAIETVHAEDVFILPNNKNIILAANQAKEMTESCRVHVIPTKTIPQGISALVNYIPEHSAEDNETVMTSELERIASGEVTYAVRDTVIEGTDIKEGDLMGIGDNGLLSVGRDLPEVIREMVSRMITDESELISLYLGEDFPPELEDTVSELLTESFPQADVEINEGGQPVYYVILSVE